MISHQRYDQLVSKPHQPKVSCSFSAIPVRRRQTWLGKK